MAERLEEHRFSVGADSCAAWLHLPSGNGPHPFIVMAHSTAGLRQLTCYAGRGREFADAGVATFQFDARGFGASDGRPRQLYDVRRQAEELEAAIGFARRLPALDAARLGLWGASASCAQVLDATRLHDAAAVVCLAPFVPGRETQRSAGTPIARLARAALADRIRSVLGREPSGVKVAGRPGEASILVREDAAAGERSLLPADARVDADGQRAELADGVVWENRVVLRPRLRTPNPLRLAPKVAAPVLVLAGEEDLLCPPGPAAELARRLPAGDLRILSCGHFDLYRGAAIEVETTFLAARLNST